MNFQNIRLSISIEDREKLLWTLACATFIIFFQAYMIAPLIPKLSALFKVSKQLTGTLVPAYLIPYAVTTLFYGLLADRFKPTTIIRLSLAVFVVLTALTATSDSMSKMLLWRVLTGIGASGVVPIALALTGRLFSFEERGRPMGWLFGAMAGGAACGSTIGVAVEPLIGWRMLFIGLALFAGIVLSVLSMLIEKIDTPGPARMGMTFFKIVSIYYGLISNRRGLRTYLYVYCNGLFHAGVFTWLGLLFKEKYGLGELQIGIALLGYGLPGFIFGPLIGSIADKRGRKLLLPTGILLSALSVITLAFNFSLILSCILVTILSLGYDLSQPLLAAIVTDFGRQYPGQAMGFNVFLLFMGFGTGSILFGVLMVYGWIVPLLTFGFFQMGIGILGYHVFRSEDSKLIT